MMVYDCLHCCRSPSGTCAEEGQRRQTLLLPLGVVVAMVNFAALFRCFVVFSCGGRGSWRESKIFQRPLRGQRSNGATFADAITELRVCVGSQEPRQSGGG